jgi:hypothetical protein
MNAMKTLLENNYLGLTMGEARGKWVGISKEQGISEATKYGLSPNEVLTSANMDKFMQTKIKGEGKWDGGNASITTQ